MARRGFTPTRRRQRCRRLDGGASPALMIMTSCCLDARAAPTAPRVAAQAADVIGVGARGGDGGTAAGGARRARIPSRRDASRRRCAAALRPDPVVGRTLRRGAPRAAAGARSGAGLHRRARRADERRVVVGTRRARRATRPTRSSRRTRGIGRPAIVRDRLDAASRPWWAGVSYANDSFSDDRDAWHEIAALADATDAARLRHPPRQRGAALRPRRSDDRGGVLPAHPAGHLRVRRRRRRAGFDALSVLPRRVRSVSVGRRRLRGVRRLSTARLRRADEHLRRHRQQVRRELDAHRQGVPRSRRGRSWIRRRITAASGATSGATASATSASPTATDSAARRSGTSPT